MRKELTFTFYLINTFQWSHVASGYRKGQQTQDFSTVGSAVFNLLNLLGVGVSEEAVNESFEIVSKVLCDVSCWRFLGKG